VLQVWCCYTGVCYREQVSVKVTGVLQGAGECYRLQVCYRLYGCVTGYGWDTGVLQVTGCVLQVQVCVQVTCMLVCWLVCVGVGAVVFHNLMIVS